MKPTAIVLAFLLCVLVLLSACSKDSASHPDESVSPRAAACNPPCGVAGIALINHGGFQSVAPTPSPLPAGFGSSDLLPLKGSQLVIVALSGQHTGDVVARLRSDADGLFAAQLPPGHYEVRGRFPHQPVAGKAAFTVTEGRFTRVMVQGGIIF